MHIGSVKEIWRFPVKSMGGATVDSACIHQFGIAGDRGWAVIDAETRDILSAKKFPALLNLMARYEADPGNGVAYGEEIPGVSICLPDGETIPGGADQSARLSEFLGHPVVLGQLQAPDNLDYYRMSAPMSPEDMLRMFNVKPGEDGPDLSDYDPAMIEKLMEFACPPGTHYDVFPLHLLTTSALEHMSGLSGEDFDHRRFRPSLLLETAPGIEGVAEFGWVGKSLRIGEVLLKVESRTIRCSMPSRPQAQYGLAQNPAISKSIYQQFNRYFGVNLTVQETGQLREGDAVELLD